MYSIRAFFAIPLPHSLRPLFKRILLSLKEKLPPDIAHLSKLDNLHITLQFIQKFNLEHLYLLNKKVKEELAGIDYFNLTLEGLQPLPSPKRAKVIAMEAKPEDKLSQLADAIGRSIETLGYSLGNQHFRGHLTLGRLHCNSNILLSLNEITLPPIPLSQIREVCLFESKNDKNGLHYQPLAYFKLGRMDT